MRILVRENKDGELKYVWKRIDILGSVGRDISRDLYYIGDESYNADNIMDVMNDTRKKYVWCSSCGKVIRNDPKLIADHISERKSQADCIKCRYHRINTTSPKKTKIKYVKGEGNNVIVKEEYNGELYCSISYGYNTPEQAQANRRCIYYRCNEDSIMTFNENDSIWLRYPHMFDAVVTEAKLLKNGWRCTNNGGLYGELNREFKYKTYSLYAYTDVNGVIHHFNARCRQDDIDFKYSKRYDKFMRRSHEYEFSGWMWGSKRNNIMQAVRDLYN